MTHRYKIKKVFTNLILSYVVMLVLPCVVIGLMYGQAVSLARQSSVDESLVVLRQARADLNERIGLMDKASMQLVADMDIKAMMSMERPKPGSPEIYAIAKFSNALPSKLAVASDNATNYRILFKDNELVFYGSAMTSGLEFYYHSALEYEGVSYAQWYDLVFSLRQRALLPSALIKTAQGTMSGISYVYPLPKGVGQENGGLVYFLLSDDSVLKTVISADIDSIGAFFILNEQGQTLVKTGRMGDTDIQMERMDKQEGYYYLTGEKSSDIVVYTFCDQRNLYFASRLPESVVMSKAMDVQRMAVLLFGITLLVETLLGISFARKNASPVNNFVKNVRLLFLGENDKQADISQYEYLEKSVVRMIDAKNSMHEALEEKKSLQRRLFLDKLLDGGFSSNAQAYENARLGEVEIAGQEYCVVAFMLALPVEEAQPLLEEKAPPLPQGGWIFHSLDGQTLLGIACFEKKDAQENKRCLREAVDGIVNLLQETTGSPCRAGIGRMYEDVSSISFSHGQACYCVARRQAEGEAMVIEYQDIPRYKNSLYYPVELENKLVNAARHRNTPEIRDVFADLREENLHRRHLSVSMEKILCANLQASLLKVSEDLMEAGEPLEEALERVGKLTELSDALDLLEQEFLRIGGRKEEQQSLRHRMLKGQMEGYIRENYPNSTLSVARMAGDFGLSESYFSQVFKETMGCAFSAYLETVRLTKARELILHTEHDIETISQMVGYNNSTTFRRAFKRAEGISPIAYKQHGAPGRVK